LNENENTITSSGNFIYVPSSWTVYEMGESSSMAEIMRMTEAGKGFGLPPIAVMEAMVMTKRATRVATIHTFNANVGDDEEGEPESPFDEE
jgi:hypothetical protein